MNVMVRPFRVVLPILTFALAAAVFVGFALVRYVSLKSSAHGADTVYFAAGEFELTVSAADFKHFALMGAAVRLHKPIIILDAPGHFGALIIPYLVSHNPFGYPFAFAREFWQCLTYPLFALPAWWFVGLGIDAFLGRKRIGTAGVVTSIALALLFGIIAFGLRFGLSPEDRREQDQLPSYVAGFALWSVLFLLPFASWLTRKITVKNSAVVINETGA